MDLKFSHVDVLVKNLDEACTYYAQILNARISKTLVWERGGLHVRYAIALMGQERFMLVPAPWLAKELSLTPLASNSQTYADSLGVHQFISGRSADDGSHAYVQREPFENFLNKNKLDCVRIFVAERSAFPGGGNDLAAWRRS